MNYGTRDWLEAQYAASGDDPWGLDWRPSQRYRYLKMIAALEAATGPGWRPGRIVDVGAATGGFTAMLAAMPAAQGAQVTGIDIAQQAVVRARQNHPGIAFERMSIAEAPAAFPDTGLVTCLEVLYYLPRAEREAAVRDLAAMLAPGGYLLASSMIAGGHYFTLAELKALIGAVLPVKAAGALYLKPVTLVEKALMKLGVAQAGSGREALARVASQEKWSKRLMGETAASHGYVIARRER